MNVLPTEIAMLPNNGDWDFKVADKNWLQALEKTYYHTK
jgi:hypothetical protein